MKTYQIRLITVRETIQLEESEPIAYCVDAVRSHAKKNGIHLHNESIGLSREYNQPRSIAFQGFDEYDWPCVYVIILCNEEKV
jgi:hypothetical protein